MAATEAVELKLELPIFGEDSWGPDHTAVEPFNDLPFTNFSKRDPINFVANWNATRVREGRKRMGDDSAILGDLAGDDDDTGFGVVLRTKTYDRTDNKKSRWRKDTTKQAAKVREIHQRLSNKGAQRILNAPTTQARQKRQIANRRRKQKQRSNLKPTVLSVKKSDDWVDVKELSMEQMELNYDYQPQSEKSLFLAGNLHQMLTVLDEVSSVTVQPLNLKCSPLYFQHFHGMSACQDPHLLQMAASNRAKASDMTLYTTDEVLTALMNCQRSKYSFDVIFNKIGNQIFLDQRPNTLSTLHVDETSSNRPTDKKYVAHNKYTRLAEEAKRVNQTFGEQIVSHSLKQIKRMKYKHPFADQKNAKMHLAATSFVYREFQLSDNVKLVCRCSVAGRNSDNKLVTAFALNQYDHSLSRTPNWLKDLDRMDASITLTEFRNNSFKVTRWLTQSILADAQFIKIGFITRVKPNNPDEHSIVGVRTYTPNDMARKMSSGSDSYRMRNCWATLGVFIDIIKELPNGRFCLLRDALKPYLRLYEVPHDMGTGDDPMQHLPTYEKLAKSVSP